MKKPELMQVECVPALVCVFHTCTFIIHLLIDSITQTAVEDAY